MWNFLRIAIQAFQPVISEAMRAAVLKKVGGAELQGAIINCATDAIATVTHHQTIGAVAATVVESLAPHITTWSPDELATAAAIYQSRQLRLPGTSLDAPFTAGATWAAAHQIESLKTGIANAAAESSGTIGTGANNGTEETSAVSIGVEAPAAV